MLVYTNRGKEIKLKSNEIESIDVVVKKVVGTPFIPYQYVYGFSNAKIKVRSVIEIEINGIIVDEYEKDIVVGSDMLGYFDGIKDIKGNELLTLVRNNFENEKNMLIEIILRNRIK